MLKCAQTLEYQYVKHLGNGMFRHLNPWAHTYLFSGNQLCLAKRANLSK